jgi:hypothetical protein
MVPYKAVIFDGARSLRGNPRPIDLTCAPRESRFSVVAESPSRALTIWDMVGASDAEEEIPLPLFASSEGSRLGFPAAVAVLLCVGPANVPAGAAEDASAPNFAPDRATAWVPDRPTGDDFLPPTAGPGPVTSAKDRPYVPNGAGRQPTYRIADLSNPILQPWAIERMKKANDEVLAGKVPYITRERCWPAGVPGFTVYTRVQPIYFLQGPKAVVIVNELNAQLRHVYLDVPHSPRLTPSWYGESVGHYEGDELVVDTIGLNDKTFVDNYRTPHTDRIHVVERFKLIEGGNILQATVTVDDPGAFNMPWSATQRWRRVERELTEQICAENNFDFFNYNVTPIPQAERPDF